MLALPYVRIKAMTDSVGARLRQARELRRLTLQQASETTKVRTHYLQALESDDYSAIPSAAQARGFLRIYAGFLELDVADLLPGAQPAAMPSSDEAALSAAGPAASQASRPGLWAGLRELLAHRPGKHVETEASPASPALESDEQQPAPMGPLPASIEAQTTRPIKPASADVKKNAKP